MPSQKQKIAFVLPTLTAGGAERVLLTLMNRISRDRFEPHLIVLDERGPLKEWISDDVSVHMMGQIKIKSGVLKLARQINDIAPDVVVSTMAAMNFGVLLARPFLKVKPKIIIREAVIPSSIVEYQRFPFLVKTAYRMLYPYADHILSPAGCIIDEFPSYLNMDTRRHILLHNPVDLEKVRKDESATLPAIKDREKKRHFVCAGRLHQQKGFDRLINALTPFAANMDWHLQILGEGVERDTLQALIQACGLEHHVELCGLVKQPWPIIAAADAFLLPSRWEGLPNVALESLAVGTRVISSAQAGGIQEIADEAAAGDVTVTHDQGDDMDAFIAAMMAVQAAPTERARPSLLPDEFELNAVVRRFEEILLK